MSCELYHYGVKGMKWGVRRYQNRDRTWTRAGKIRYGDKSASDSKHASTKSKSTSEAGNEEESTKKKGLTDKQKKALMIGAAAVGTGLAIYGGYKLSQMYKGVGQAVDPETGFRLLDKNTPDSKLLSDVNPGRINILSWRKNTEIINGSSQNCMLCTTAYDLRKRGFDVHAGYSTQGYMPDMLFSKIYKNYGGTSKIDVSNLANPKAMQSEIEKSLLKHGPGSRGNIVVWWKHAGGHSMIWENVDGKIVFKDGQTNEVYKDFGNRILRNASLSKPIELLRTDNLELNYSEVMKVINSDTKTKTYVDHGAEIAAKLALDPKVQLMALGGYYGGKAISDKQKEKKNDAKKQQSKQGR